MKLLQLTATFGCLQGDTLEFGPGMTLIGAPNGSGKSTWCAFLRTMLYGLDTRQRDRKGAPADKNRYRPWSGSPTVSYTHLDVYKRQPLWNWPPARTAWSTSPSWLSAGWKRWRTW